MREESAMQNRLLIHTLSAVVVLPLLSIPVLAADSGGSSVPTCPKGQVYDSGKKKCVSKQSRLDDKDIYENGRALALAGRYDEAISVLVMAKDKTDPGILTYLGYAHRKSGRIGVGLGYYQEALVNNPNATLTREYMGEAYLQLGDLAGARQQLAEIEKRVGKASREYGMLSEQIDRFLRS
jgi:tetratricopeptide (TPR) repeat protein